MEEKKPDEVGIEKHFSPAQIAGAMGLSTKTVCRMLESEEGIIRIGRHGLNRTRITIRVPQSTWERIHEKWMRAELDSPGGKARTRRSKGQEGSGNGRQK